jgi:translation initiation factor 2 subunit 1
MLYIKEGYPQSGEIVLCTVRKIYGNTTFVTLDEYEKEGVLTISEIAPGRIRNLREYVVENKKIVCKILRVDEKSRRIDVSLRRVPVPIMKEKLEQIKKEEYSQRIYQEAAEKIGISIDQLFEKTYEPIFENYEMIFEALYEIMLDNNKIDIFTNLKSKEKQILIEIINSRIKPEEITFKQKFNIISHESDGIEQIKSLIKESLNSLNYDKVNIIYLAAGLFEIKIIHEDRKSADKVYNQFKKVLEENSKKKNISVNFQDSKKN